MDYEKKYRDLVEAVKELQEANPSDEGIQKWVEDNVPELADRHMKIIYEEQTKSLLYHNAIIKQSAIIDSQPKNMCFPVPKGEEYKHMCMSLAQGYEIDWVDYYAEIIVNEFGEPESFDSFKKRHPNFAEDIENAFLDH